MGLKNQIQEAVSVSEIKRLVTIAGGFKMADPKTIRQIKREGERRIGQLNTVKKNTKQKTNGDQAAIQVGTINALGVQRGGPA